MATVREMRERAKALYNPVLNQRSAEYYSDEGPTKYRKSTWGKAAIYMGGGALAYKFLLPREIDPSGVLNLVWIRPNIGGRLWSRPMANETREELYIVALRADIVDNKPPIKRMAPPQ